MLERTAYFYAALQLTLFIVSGSPSNTMLCGCDQNTMLGIESPVSLMLVHAPRCFIVSCSSTNKIFFCDQSTIWKVEMEWKVLCGTCCFVAKFFISGFPTYTMLGGG